MGVKCAKIGAVSGLGENSIGGHRGESMSPPLCSLTGRRTPGKVKSKCYFNRFSELTLPSLHLPGRTNLLCRLGAQQNIKIIMYLMLDKRWSTVYDAGTTLLVQRRRQLNQQCVFYGLNRYVILLQFSTSYSCLDTAPHNIKWVKITPGKITHIYLI